MKNRIGRPKAAPQAMKVPGISARLTLTERQIIALAVKKSGIRQSEWVRRSMMYAAEHEIFSPGIIAHIDTASTPVSFLSQGAATVNGGSC